MLTFLVEVNKRGEFIHDFTKKVAELLHSYAEWYDIEFRIEGAQLEDVKPDGWVNSALKSSDEKLKLDPNEVTPLGSVEFVQSYANLIAGKESPLKPINIPEELLPVLYTGREVYNIENITKANQVVDSLTSRMKIFDRWFVKDLNIIKHPDNHFYDVIKDIHNGAMTCEARIGEDGNTVSKVFDYKFADVIVGKQISQRIENVKSEWRVFVDKSMIQALHSGSSIIGCEHYRGDPLAFPNTDRILQFVEAYKHSPDIYTLDVMVDKRGTWVLECHDFFSCGLYGFEHLRLPWILQRAWFAIYKKILAEKNKTD